MGTKSIVVVGSNMIDLVCYAERLPKAGETVFGTKFCTNFGGKGSNQCVAAAKLGGRTHMITRVGCDSWGEKYIENYKTHGIDVTHVRKTEGLGNGIAQISVSESAENQIIIVPGANAALSEADVATAANLIRSASVVVCQLETPLSTALKALEITKGIGILNGAPAVSDPPKALFTTPKIFCVNESEAEVFTGLKIESVEDAKLAAERLIENGCDTVIITLGAEGSLLGTRDGVVEHVACPEAVPVDTTGAGDAFVGALAYFLSRDAHADLREAVRMAGYVATRSTTKLGTQISYPDKEILGEIMKPE